MTKRPRVLAIGLDGVPFSLLRDWAAEGHLPTIRRFIDEGVAGDLASTIPPTSGPAWTSLATGKNPGKTGIYDFLRRRDGTYVFPPVSTRTRSGQTVWRILSERGKRVSVINIPISYPVEPVNGVFVSGWMTPYFAKDYTHPPELAAEIDREVGDYRIYPSETFAESREDDFFRACDELLDLLTRTNLHVMENHEAELFMTVYFDTDRVLHQLWHYLDADHPWRSERKEELGAPVLRYFKRLDADLARLIDAAGEDAVVMLMSDHGMGRASRFIVLNNLLMKLGFIQLSRDLPTRLKAFAMRIGVSLRNVHRVFDRLGLAKHAEYKNVYSFDALLKKLFLSFSNVDWTRTQAYSFGRHYGAVFLNVKGREPEGSVEAGAEYERVREEVAKAILDYVDPELGRPLVRECLRGEDVYHGERSGEAPDLVLLPYDDADIFFGLSDFGSNRIWDGTYRYSGMHRPNGLFMAMGPGIKSGAELAEAQITDIAPTFLHLLGEAVPNDMDGAPLTQIFTPEFNEAHPVRRDGSGSESASPDDPTYSDDEEADIMDRLRDLGYLN